MSSAPLERLLTSSAIQLNATAADSGDGLMWAKTSFLAAVCQNAGEPGGAGQEPAAAVAVRARMLGRFPSRGLRSIDRVPAQYDFGNPSTFSAMKQRMSCGLTGAMRGIRISRM